MNVEYNQTRNLIRNVFKKKEPWGRKIESVSNIYWEYEEATSIVISQNKKEFYDLVKDFMYEYYTWEYDKDYAYDDILDEQINIMKDPNDDLEKWAIECLWWGRRNEKFFKDSYEVL